MHGSCSDLDDVARLVDIAEDHVEHICVKRSILRRKVGLLQQLRHCVRSVVREPNSRSVTAHVINFQARAARRRIEAVRGRHSATQVRTSRIGRQRAGQDLRARLLPLHIEQCEEVRRDVRVCAACQIFELARP